MKKKAPLYKKERIKSCRGKKEAVDLNDVQI